MRVCVFIEPKKTRARRGKNALPPDWDWYTASTSLEEAVPSWLFPHIPHVITLLSLQRRFVSGWGYWPLAAQNSKRASTHWQPALARYN
eukprot:scaffold226382_cov28-Tisochrysis_lutea.AAC.1